jgi:uncharacterized protein (DUF1778 family)
MPVTPEQRELIDHASIEQYGRLRRDQTQSQMLLAALLSAKKPNNLLRAAMKNYRK